MAASICFMLFVNLLVITWFLIKYSFIITGKLIQYAQIMRYLLNLKYNYYRRA
jgi:hypothetical protein